jgi:hypothetical protein
LQISLTDEQRTAVRAEGNSWVVACPGSGKTRVALAKVLRESARLGKSGGSVLALSFSVNAKDELAGRIAAHAGPTSRKNITVATIHGFCLGEIVIPFGSYVAGQDLRLALPGGSPYLAALLATAAKYEMTVTRLEGLLKFRRRAPDGRTFVGAEESTPALHEVVTSFWQSLLSSGYVDYPNTLYVAFEILRSKDWIREGMVAQFPTLVVDEYQDCTDIQVGLIHELVSSGSRVFLLGDLHQCVFGFAGADVDTLGTFAERVGARRLELRGTHRCPQEVVDFAERVFSRGMQPIGEAADRAGIVLVDHCANPVSLIARLVRLCDEHDLNRSEIAFVCTAKYRIEQIVKGLNAAGIAATFGRIRTEDDDWCGQLIDAYLSAEVPRDESDVNAFAEDVLGLVDRFAPQVAKLESVRSLVAETAIDNILSAERVPDQMLRIVLPQILNVIVGTLHNSKAVRKLDLEAIERELREAGARFAKLPAASITRSQALDRLRPEGKVRSRSRRYRPGQAATSRSSGFVG